MKGYLTTSEAADALGLTVIGVIAAIKRGDIKAEKVGHERRGQWLIPAAEVERYKDERRPQGRPAQE
jgi:excisionase family DNA binding protein